MSKTISTCLFICFLGIASMIASSSAQAQLFRRGRNLQPRRDNAKQPAPRSPRERKESQSTSNSGKMRAATARELTNEGKGKKDKKLNQQADAPFQTPQPGAVYFDPSTGRYFRVPLPHDRPQNSKNWQAHSILVPNQAVVPNQPDSGVEKTSQKLLTPNQTPQLTAPQPTGPRIRLRNSTTALPDSWLQLQEPTATRPQAAPAWVGPAPVTTNLVNTESVVPSDVPSVKPQQPTRNKNQAFSVLEYND